MWKGLAHIRESEVYLNMRELLYNVIAIYNITVLIRISASFGSHYNLLTVSRYLSTILSQQVSKFRYSRLKQYVDHIAFSYLHCFKLFKDMECILLPTICNYYYYYTFLFLYVENCLLFIGSLAITT